MFCLRSWLPLLVFISSASPIYILCFLSAFYWLQRPCVYCSILLFVLVFSIFDFSADWFEPRWNGDATALTKTVASFLGGNSTFTEVALETASLAVSAINGTGGSLASSAMDNVRIRMASEAGSAVITTLPNGLSAFEWIRNILDKRQLRIPCLGVVVRI
ncbi:hypothetical protein HII31_02967 [Pseudocercospora fuligena]|uniref:Uncharacterized protein n=1 Tax=Pseudocercospora fuligena TaxID=685502 RepID=A0A8H6RR30_9PEZI|nr:hypothetical protein HII31_02967 [Pseudocercospora fuligena]